MGQLNFSTRRRKFWTKVDILDHIRAFQEWDIGIRLFNHEVMNHANVLLPHLQRITKDSGSQRID